MGDKIPYTTGTDWLSSGFGRISLTYDGFGIVIGCPRWKNLGDNNWGEVSIYQYANNIFNQVGPRLNGNTTNPNLTLMFEKFNKKNI